MTTATSVSASQVNQRPWWLTLISGILAVIVGGVLLWSPLKTQVNFYLVLVQLLGFWWLLQGILDVVGIFSDRSKWGWKLFMGIVSFIAGSYVLMYPIASAIALPRIFVLMLGIWGLMYGISLLVMAFQGGGWAPGILGILAIIFGFSLMASYYKFGTGLSLIWTAAWFAVISGIFMVVQAFRQRSA